MSQALVSTRDQRALECATRTRGNGRSSHASIGGTPTLVREMGRAVMVQAYEVRLIASLAANLPLRLIGGGRDRAFGDEPPVQAQPALATCPVLLVHGFGGTKSSWSYLARTLRARGVLVDTVTYAPFGTSVEKVADQLAIEVARLLSRTGADKVHLVGHSLGGVVIAQAITSGRLAGRVDTVVTLGAPFGGSPWAHLLPFGSIARALRGDSPLLRRLASASVPEGVRWLAFTATLDMVVPGLRSVPLHPGVETVVVDGVGHLGMLLSRHVVGRVVAALQACG